MDEKMKKFIPLFVLIGLVVVAAAIYITVYHVGMPTRDISLWGRQRTFGLVYVKALLSAYYS